MTGPSNWMKTTAQRSGQLQGYLLGIINWFCKLSGKNPASSGVNIIHDFIKVIPPSPTQFSAGRILLIIFIILVVAALIYYALKKGGIIKERPNPKDHGTAN